MPRTFLNDEGVMDKENGKWCWNSCNKYRYWTRTREIRKAADAEWRSAYPVANRAKENARTADYDSAVAWNKASKSWTRIQ